jgi:hypothetical protein
MASIINDEIISIMSIIIIIIMSIMSIMKGNNVMKMIMK